MNHAPVAMNLASPEGELLRVNPAMCAFLGRDEDIAVAHGAAGSHTPHDLGVDMSRCPTSPSAGARDSTASRSASSGPMGTSYGDLSVQVCAMTAVPGHLT